MCAIISCSIQDTRFGVGFEIPNLSSYPNKYTVKHINRKLDQIQKSKPMFLKLIDVFLSLNMSLNQIPDIELG